MAGFKDKRDLNRYQRTGFANRGRAAGTGIIEDRYDEEVYGGYEFYTRVCDGKIATYTQEEMEEKTKEQPIRKYKVSKEEAESL